MNEIKFSHYTEDGISISGTYYGKNNDRSPLAILFHGFSSGQGNSTNEALLPKLLELQFEILTFDFRGCGMSSGTLGETTISSGIIDLHAALDGLNRIDPSFISRDQILIGSSFGGAVALAAAPNIPTIGVILKSPMLNIEGAQYMRRGDMGMQKWKEMGYVTITGKSSSTDLSYEYVSDSKKYNFFNNESIPKNIPITIIHGTDDEIAPISYSEEFVNNDIKNRKLIKIPNANHHYRDGNHFELMIQYIIEEIKYIH